MGKKVFIVHGRDDSMRKTVVKYIESLDLEPIVLFKQTSKGKTIIEKIEEQAKKCSYAIVLLSPDDYGRFKDDTELKPRARQNVILELGYMWGKLGRDKVAMLYREDVEKPSDADGIVHIPYYRKSGWREKLKKELEVVGLLGKSVADNNVPEPKSEPRLESQSLMDKKQVNITTMPGFLAPTIKVDFPTPTGKRWTIHTSADQIKGTREEFIIKQHDFYSKAIPFLYANGANHGDIILGMIWDYWQNPQNSQEK